MSTTAKARTNKDTTGRQVLYVAFELGEKNWKLGFTTGLGQKPREKNIRGKDRFAVVRELALAKKRFGFDKDCEVQSLYEAGRDGFWLHRFLTTLGVKNIVTDSTAIEVNRRKKKVKTDRIDLAKLLILLIRRDLGEKKALSSVRVPSVIEEDRRQLHREVSKTQHDRNRVTNRIKGLLANHGLKINLQQDVPTQLASMRTWDGSPLPPMLMSRLEREWEKAKFLRDQLNELEKARMELIRNGEGRALDQVRKLLALKGVGVKSAWLFAMEFFSWREFKNGKQVGSLAGLTPTPNQSGDVRRERGISKAGNKHVRVMAVEIGWCWLRHQPESELSKWYVRRYADGGPVAHKIGIVAVARKLLVAFWKYVTADVLPEGAQLKSALPY